jgi:hypothetical protein
MKLKKWLNESNGIMGMEDIKQSCRRDVEKENSIKYRNVNTA